MSIEIIIYNLLYLLIYISVAFSLIAFIFGIIYFSIAFLIEGLLNLEGRIRTEKVWRVAIKEYMEKRNRESF